MGSGLIPLTLRVKTRGLTVDDAVSCIKAACEAPFKNIELITDVAQLKSLPDPGILRFISVVELIGQDYKSLDFYKMKGFWNKCRVIDDTITHLNITRAVDELFDLKSQGVKTVNIRPGDVPDDQKLIFWLTYAERVAFQLFGGQKLTYRCFDEIVDPALMLYYRLAKGPGPELWRKYTDSPERFDAAFWLYSEIHENVLPIEIERRKRV